MADATKKAPVPDKISEEYYQICEEILSSFSKYRPPVDLFKFREDIAQLYPLFRKGQRLTNEQSEEIQALCHEGSLFVARSDHHIYVEHIAKQADLVLVDANLKESESADILLTALNLRLSAFYEQPVLTVFESLYKDVMVLTEYLYTDMFRSRLFMRRLFTGEANLVMHSLNALSVGLWLSAQTTNEIRRRSFDRMALGLLLMDAGMTKLPGFIRNKTTPLKSDEMEKIVAHPLAGLKMMQKVNLSFDELNQAILQHHERLDGSGYPQRAKGDAITSIGRLAAVADSFAAMITKRPYAEAMPQKDAAHLLADDRHRYDVKYSVPLHNAYLIGEF
jgi:response regulator RpfG family c-di-GMP phosphodiesterase